VRYRTPREITRCSPRQLILRRLYVRLLYLFDLEVLPWLVRRLNISFNLRRRSSCEAMSASSNPLADSSADLRSISYNRSLTTKCLFMRRTRLRRNKQIKREVIPETFWADWITVSGFGTAWPENAFRLAGLTALCRAVKCRYD